MAKHKKTDSHLQGLDLKPGKHAAKHKPEHRAEDVEEDPPRRDLDWYREQAKLAEGDES